MSFPEDLLSSQEKVMVHSHPHAKMLIGPFFWLLVTLGAGGFLATLAQGLAAPWGLVSLAALAIVAVILVSWLFVGPLIRWRTTHFVVTTDRLIAREGVLKRTGLDIPMTRINSVQFEHGLIDRIFGCGTLIIESASEEPLRFEDIPRVERVHTLIYREVNDNPYDDYADRGDGHQRGHGRR